MNQTILILLILILAISCQTNKEKKVEKEKIKLNGNWEYLGFGKAIGEIKDGHITIALPDDLEEQYKLLKENNNNTENSDEDNGELSTKIRTKIVEDYLKKPRTFNRGSLNYGQLNNNIGYLEIQNMVTMAHYNGRYLFG